MSRAAKASGAAGHTIRVVAARTGLEMGTLRAWERRYGFPRPERRPDSNRRLYSDADVTRLAAIQRALAQGYRVGDVIQKGLRELEELAPVEPAAEPAHATVESLLKFVEQDRVSEFESLLRKSAAALGPRQFVTEVAHPLAVAVGAAWASGRLSIRHEHVATECLVTQLRQMLAGYQDIQARPLVLLATFPDESHTLPLALVALYLVVSGAKPRLLGGPTPARDIAESARLLHADVVGIAVTNTGTRARVASDVAALRAELERDVPLWLGGAGARTHGSAEQNVHVVESWEAIDRALGEWRARRVRRAPSARGAR